MLRRYTARVSGIRRGFSVKQAPPTGYISVPALMLETRKMLESVRAIATVYASKTNLLIKNVSQICNPVRNTR